MLEIAPGVYTSPKMTRGIRDRVWKVLSDWYATESSGHIIMTWQDSTLASGQSIATLELPARDIIVHDGIFLVRKDLTDLEIDL